MADGGDLLPNGVELPQIEQASQLLDAPVDDCGIGRYGDQPLGPKDAAALVIRSDGVVQQIGRPGDPGQYDGRRHRLGPARVVDLDRCLPVRLLEFVQQAFVLGVEAFGVARIFAHLFFGVRGKEAFESVASFAALYRPLRRGLVSEESLQFGERLLFGLLRAAPDDQIGSSVADGEVECFPDRVALAAGADGLDENALDGVRIHRCVLFWC